MKREKPEGAAFILLETDMEHAKPLDEATLSELQRAWLARLSDEVRLQILEGQAGSVIDLSDGSAICEYNMETYMPPQDAIDSFARSLLPQIQEYYKKNKTP